MCVVWVVELKLVNCVLGGGCLEWSKCVRCVLAVNVVCRGVWEGCLRGVPECVWCVL